MASDELWSILLTQPCMCTDIAVLCKLLCCSKALGSMAAKACSGHVVLHTELPTVAAAKQLEQWLAQRGHMLQELHILPCGRSKGAGDPDSGVQSDTVTAGSDMDSEEESDDEEQTAEQQQALVRLSAIEAGLQHAAKAAAPQGLQLRSFRCVSSYSTAGVLQHLPVGCLTQLELHVDPSSTKQWQLQRMYPDLAKLTALQHLVFDVKHSEADGGRGRRGTTLGDALAQLQCLTHLKLTAEVTAADLVQLPDSLVNLCVLRSPDAHPEHPYLQLGHLTAVTQLQIGPDPYLQDVAVLQAADVLPPHVKRLWVDGLESCAALLQLHQLGQLHIEHCTAAPQELLQLTSLTGLAAVSIANRGKSDEDAASQVLMLANADSATFQLPPLVRLAVHLEHVPRPAVVALGRLTKLTRLEIGADVEFGVTPSELAMQLQSLTNLEKLRMEDFMAASHPDDVIDNDNIFTPEQIEIFHAAGGTELRHAEDRTTVLAAVAQLPKLRCLCLVGNIWEDALSQLTAATLLTGLAVLQCYISDDTLTALAACLTALRDLHLGDGSVDDPGPDELDAPPVLTGACLPALANLQHLTALRMDAHEIDIIQVRQYPKLETLMRKRSAPFSKVLHSLG